MVYRSVIIYIENQSILHLNTYGILFLVPAYVLNYRLNIYACPEQTSTYTTLYPRSVDICTCSCREAYIC